MFLSLSLGPLVVVIVVVGPGGGFTRAAIPDRISVETTRLFFFFMISIGGVTRGIELCDDRFWSFIFFSFVVQLIRFLFGAEAFVDIRRAADLF